MLPPVTIAHGVGHDDQQIEIAVLLEIAAGWRAVDVNHVRAGQGDYPVNDRPNAFIYKRYGRHLYVGDRP